MDHLLSPLEIRGKHVKNRVTFTAHTQSYSDNGIHGDRVRNYYAARAAGGTGFLVMEPIPPHPTGRVTPRTTTTRSQALWRGSRASSTPSTSTVAR